MVLAKKWERPWRGFAKDGRIRLDGRALNPHYEGYAELSWLQALPAAIAELVASLLEVTCAADDDARFNDPMLTLDVQNARYLIAVWERRGKALLALKQHEREE